MGRMMPGRVRQEGISLYEDGQVAVDCLEEGQLFLRIAGEDFCYSTKDEEVSCTCLSFQQRQYCPHLAAAEYFLKNDPQGKEKIQLLEESKKKVEVIARKTYAGGVFLDQLLQPLSQKIWKYQLSTEGSLRPFEQQIDWTLKIGRLPDQRSYIIRDIGAFLRLVQQGGHYQIGKNYYEPVSLEQFDQASQDVIEFLWKLLPTKSISDSDILIHFGRNLRLPLLYFEEGLSLLQELSSFVFEHGLVTYTDLQTAPYEAIGGHLVFSVKVHQQMIELQLLEKPFRSLLHGYYLLENNYLYSLTPKQRQLMEWTRGILVKEEGHRSIQVDFQDKDKLSLALFELQEIGQIKAPKQFQIRPFAPSFSLSLEGQQLQLQTVFHIEGLQVSNQQTFDSLPFSIHYQQVETIFHTIAELGFIGKFTAQRKMFELTDWYDFLRKELPRLQRLGEVRLSEDLNGLVVVENSTLSIERTGSLLDISFDFSNVDSTEVAAAVDALLDEKEYFISKNGKILVFDQATKQISQTLLQLRARYGKDGRLQLSNLASYPLAAAIQEQNGVHISEEFQELVTDLIHPEHRPMPSVHVRAHLREYQELGVKWLSMLDQYGFGGILADDMGLGKTLQLIAFLSSKLHADSKVLILAPASLIYNWQDECQRFAPDLDVAVVYGPKTERESILSEDHTILVTSYASFRQDIDLYKARRYDYLILDEAQVMKNAQTKIAQQLREFEVGNCFALSGTPIENHLSEIWSIFQIVLPGLLPSQTEFQKLPAATVARMIKPFVLRRKKEDVLLELPDLIEVNVLNELTDQQKVLYLAQLQQMKGSILGASETEINRKKIEILAGITRLRQICDTPQLFMETYQGDSGKLDSLKELLLRLKEGNHRVLIFSQFRQMLDIIETQLEELDISSYKLTGSTLAKDRQEMTSAFNAGSRDAFLISLKAGGVGLNLTGADTVILVDLWWNPAVEAQAISRAHRMGQTQKVEFYRLITRGTIEEKIQTLQETKKNLVTAVLDGDDSRSTLTADEIKEILGIS